jgi:hypothetical protein
MLMKELHREQLDQVRGGLDSHQTDAQLAPDPQATDPNIVIDYNPPQPPQ